MIKKTLRNPKREVKRKFFQQNLGRFLTAKLQSKHVYFFSIDDDFSYVLCQFQSLF